jgi:hypothetical protein
MSTPRDPGWKNMTYPTREISIAKIREFYRKKGKDDKWQKPKPKDK